MRYYCIILFLFLPAAMATSYNEFTGSSSDGNGRVYYYMNWGWPFVTDAEKNLMVPCANTCIVTAMGVNHLLTLPADNRSEIRINSRECLTLECVRNKWVKNFGASGSNTILTAQKGSLDECWAMAVFPITSPTSAGPGRKLLDSVCTYIPPEIVKCSMNDVVQIDHGVLPVGDTTGHAATEVVNIFCSRTASISFRLLQGDAIDMDPSGDLQSILYLQGQRLSSQSPLKLQLGSGSSSLSLKSILAGTLNRPIAAGLYVGSTVIIMQFN